MTPTPVEAAILARLDTMAGQVLVGVTGIEGAGKTRFSDRLAALVLGHGRPALRLSISDFHRPRADRYAKGRASPEGFVDDSTDYAAFLERVVAPLAPGGSGIIRPASFDVTTDTPREPDPVRVPDEAVVVVDGIFLIRAELARAFDLTVFLDVEFDEAYGRMARRDGVKRNPEAPENIRHRQGQQLWLDRCDPRARADMVIDNNDWAHPVLLRDKPVRD